MHLAARDGNLAEVNQMLDEGEDVDARNGYGATPLSFAVGWNQLAITEELLARGANPNLPDVQGQTPLFKTCDTTFAGPLIEAGADVNFVDGFGRTPLHDAIRCALAMEAGLVVMLLDAGADPNTVDETGMTPLHLAVELGEPESIDALLAAGADVDAVSQQGLTPLDVSTLLARDEATGMLSASGSAPEKYRESDFTAALLVRGFREDGIRGTSLESETSITPGFQHFAYTIGWGTAQRSSSGGLLGMAIDRVASAATNAVLDNDGDQSPPHITLDCQFFAEPDRAYVINTFSSDDGGPLGMHGAIGDMGTEEIVGRCLY